MTTRLETIQICFDTAHSNLTAIINESESAVEQRDASLINQVHLDETIRKLKHAKELLRGL